MFHFIHSQEEEIPTVERVLQIRNRANSIRSHDLMLAIVWKITHMIRVRLFGMHVFAFTVAEMPHV